MPELPEVEQFRHLLLPLVKNNNTTGNGYEEYNIFQIVQHEMNHKGINISEDQLVTISQNYFCSDVVRKGKQLCLILKHRSVGNTVKSITNGNINIKTLFLYLHMGMTGCIRIPGRAENWGDRKDTESSTGSTEEQTTRKSKSKRKGMLLKAETVETLKEKGVKPNKYIQSTTQDNENESNSNHEIFPPKYTIVTFEYNGYKAAFTDSRKFGSCSIITPTSDDEDPFHAFGLAPDSYTTTDTTVINEYIIPKFMNQAVGIKAILLDQKRAVSGVGNWIADEVLYQCKIHPDQKFLSYDEAMLLWNTVNEVCTIAVECLTKENTHYPIEWLFGYRWTNKKAGKDYYGQSISFLTSGGRTSAIIPSQQKLYSRAKAMKQANSKSKERKTSGSNDSKPSDIDKEDHNDSAENVSCKSLLGDKRNDKYLCVDGDKHDFEPVEKTKKPIRNLITYTGNSDGALSTRQRSRRKYAETSTSGVDDSSDNVTPTNGATTKRSRSSKTNESKRTTTSKYFASSNKKTKTKSSRKAAPRKEESKQSVSSSLSRNTAPPTIIEKEMVIVTTSDQDERQEGQTAMVPLRPGLRPRNKQSTSKYFAQSNVEQQVEPPRTRTKPSSKAKLLNGKGKSDYSDQQDLQTVTVVHQRESPNIVTPIPGNSDSGSS